MLKKSRNQSFKTLLAPLSEPSESSSYEVVDPLKLEQIASSYRWITEPLFKASLAINTMPFFAWVESLQSAQDFKNAAKQLYYHSATFPKVMGLMLGNTPMSENIMMPFYAKHAYGEASHHEMLMRWMLQHGILANRAMINNLITTPETNACINLAYQLAIEQDRSKWIIAINCGIERCSNEFFKLVAPKMHALGIGDIYFDIHVEADEHHSIMGLKYVETPTDINRRQKLIAKGLEGVSLWAAMLHSWIGINLHPQFDLDGNLLEATG